MNVVNTTPPIVSVCILTFNHTECIKQALESVLSQKCSFSYEIVITDNCSTDGTQKLLKEYEEKYPDIIRLYLEEAPISFVDNNKAYFTRTSGKYIAILDGDDYWCYEKKLETQVAFLEENGDYNGCFHDEEILHSVDTLDARKEAQSFNRFRSYSQINYYPTILFPEHIIQRTIVPSSSLVFRKTKKQKAQAERFPLNFDLSADWLGMLEVVRSSKLRYFNHQWSVYRDHPKGISKDVPSFRFHEVHVDILRLFLKDEFYGSPRYKHIVLGQVAEEYLMLYNLDFTASYKRLFKYALLHTAYSTLKGWSFVFYVIKSQMEERRLQKRG